MVTLNVDTRGEPLNNVSTGLASQHTLASGRTIKRIMSWVRDIGLQEASKLARIVEASHIKGEEKLEVMHICPLEEGCDSCGCPRSSGSIYG
jgi:hypothetical protein